MIVQATAGERGERTAEISSLSRKVGQWAEIMPLPGCELLKTIRTKVLHLY